jgi:hypothetical protein
MDFVTLPLVAARTTLEATIERMNDSDRRSVIVRQAHGGLTVHTNKQVLSAWSRRMWTAGEMPEGARVANLAHLGDLKAIWSAPNGYAVLEKALDRFEAQYGLVAVRQDGRTAEIVTRHEQLTKAATYPTRECVCLNDTSHNGSSPPADQSGCPFGCGGVWRCA